MAVKLNTSLYNLHNDIAMNIGQSEVSSLKLVCQPLVIDPQAMQDSGVEVMGGDRVARDVVAEIIGFAD
jgi:hypothetical protein